MVILYFKACSYVYTYLCTKIIVLYELSHVISQNLDGGATEADGRASAPVGPSVATPLLEEACTV